MEGKKLKIQETDCLYMHSTIDFSFFYDFQQSQFDRGGMRTENVLTLFQTIPGFNDPEK